MGRVSKDTRITVLRDVSLFEACSAKELRHIAGIVTPLDVEAGHVLAREGARSRQFGVLVDGEATVTIAGALVDTIGPGGFYGEAALVTCGRHASTVTARTDVHQLVLDQWELRSLVNRSIPSVTLRLVTCMAERLRRADERSVSPLAPWGSTDPRSADPSGDAPRPHRPADRRGVARQLT